MINEQTKASTGRDVAVECEQHKSRGSGPGDNNYPRVWYSYNVIIQKDIMYPSDFGQKQALYLNTPRLIFALCIFIKAYPNL